MCWIFFPGLPLQLGFLNPVRQGGSLLRRFRHLQQQGPETEIGRAPGEARHAFRLCREVEHGLALRHEAGSQVHGQLTLARSRQTLHQ